MICEPHKLPVRVGEPFSLDQCRACWLSFGGDPHAPIIGVEQVNPNTVPCIHRGPLVPLQERYRLSLGVLRDWFKCGKGHSHLNSGYVCPCQGCNHTCPDYNASEDQP